MTERSTSERRQVRQAETISLASPGALLELNGESFAVADTARWQPGPVFHEPRLERQLDVTGFRAATGPAEDGTAVASDHGLPVVRFPRWLYCPKCRHMEVYDDAVEDPAVRPRCGCAAHRPLAPMPYVMICRGGHLADVPWETWVHASAPCREPAARLSFHAASVSDAQAGTVRCTCGERRSLAGITRAQRDHTDEPDVGTARQPALTCPGSQPWLPERRCTSRPLIVHRNARNVHFAAIASAIDIPPHADYDPDRDARDAIRKCDSFQQYVTQPAPTPFQRRRAIREMHWDTDLSVPLVTTLLPELEAIARVELAATAPDAFTEPMPAEPPVLPPLESEEYAILRGPDRGGHPRNNFRTVRQELPTGALDDAESATAAVKLMLADRLDCLVAVTRLREVRVLAGFSRVEQVNPIATQKETVGTRVTLLKPWLDRPQSWLPAVETFGEGIFFALNEQHVRDWEARPDVAARAARLQRRAVGARIAGTSAADVSARLILLHTVSHLLMRQLSLTCGYPLASLRERIYAAPADASQPMAGILISTTAGDRRGTLGGLVREAAPARFLDILIQALVQEDWCAADPLCRESLGQGPDALNLAACHACALVPETSCTLGNRLLDRSLVLGSPTDRPLGYFGLFVGSSLAAATDEGDA